MQHDKKVGLALAILLVSIVGAFFFREEGSRGRGTPELKNPQQLDEAIAKGRDKRPYNETDSSKPHAHEVRRPAARPKDDLAPWELPEFLREDEDQSTAQRAKMNASKSPFDLDELKVEAPKSAAPKLRVPVDHRAIAVPQLAENGDWQPLDYDKRVAQREHSKSPSLAATGRNHVVAAGETLSSIAEKYLGSQTRYQDIFQANRDQLRSPNDLKVGMKLMIPERAGSKSSDTSRKLDANQATSERSTKSARPTFTAPTSKVTSQPEANDPSNNAPSKLKFKPSKSSPGFRRSADAGNEQLPGQALSQLPPGDFSEVGDGLLADLEHDLELPAPPADEKLATEPSPFRFASDEPESPTVE